MKSLFELRKEAQAMGIEGYAAMSKETLAKVIEESSQPGQKVQNIEPEEALSPEEKAAVDAAEKEYKKEEKMSPIERLAARNEKLARDKEEKAIKAKNKAEAQKIEKAEERRLKEEAKVKAAAEKIEAAQAKKEAKRLEREAKKAEKPASSRGPRNTSGLYNFTPKGEKPDFRTGRSSEIYDELLLNDGRSYGEIARDISSHYNMVRRVADLYFNSGEPAVKNSPDPELPFAQEEKAPVENPGEETFS